MSVRTVKQGALEYLVADGIAAPHCFTTRFGGVSAGHVASMNLSMRRDADPENVVKNFHILADTLGFDPKNLVLTNQTHSDIVLQVTADDHQGFNTHDYPECDALVTNTPGTALCVFTADCTPVLLYDPVTGAVGAAHAGWRGTVAKIAAKTALEMVRLYGSDPKNLRAAIGPNIGGCCFETDRDVPDAIQEAYGDAAAPFISQRGEKYFLDLKQINAISLREIGVNHIELSDACTACQPNRFWSHRVTRGLRGSQGAIILCKEVQP